MPTPEQVRTAIENHFRFWNAGDRAGWIRNFAENVVFHDPVGSPPKHGRSAAEKSWDNSFSNGQKWTLVLTQLVVCGDEAAITLDNHGVVNGQAFTMRGIEIWKTAGASVRCGRTSSRRRRWNSTLTSSASATPRAKERAEPCPARSPGNPEAYGDTSTGT
jgi:ketosteroid isomerase-like protein